jgi:ABC-type sugar transport system ATPase subunit
MQSQSTVLPPERGRPEVAIGAAGLAKRFGHVQALSNASITVRPGEVVALFGDNGAGKSTLVKMLLGLIQPDSGEITIADEKVELSSVRDAQTRGIDCVYQDLALAPDLSVVDNMFLGHEVVQGGPRRFFGALARGEMRDRADQALRDIGIKLPSLSVSVSDLSGGQKQAVAVAKAVMWSSTAVLMDEPTAALGARQSEIVCNLMRSVAERGLGVLVVSHDLPRVLKVADRVVILWRGDSVLEAPAADLTVPDVVATMVGYTKSVA